MSSEDQRKGKLLPDPVDPSDTVCYTIQIPNAVQYRAAFLGQLDVLGVWSTWDHPTDGTVCEDCEIAAQLFRNALYNATWSDECGDEPMSCTDVQDCIENDTGVQQAIANVVPYTPINGLTYPPGSPLTPSQMTERLNEIDECAFDPYWAQVEQYVDYMVDLGQDVLEQIAAYSAALDAGEVVPMGQFLGKLKNSSTAGKVVEFLQWVVTVMKAQYEAADNEANRNTIKCAIFCENRDSCLISIEGTLNTLNERLGGFLNPSDLADLPTLVNAFITGATDPSLALDLWLLFLMGSAKTAGMFGMQNIDETINLVLALAVNDANNDWETLCEDCPPIVEEIVMFDPAGTNGGTYSGTNSGGTFTAENTSGIWRVAFQIGEGGGCRRITSFSVSVNAVYKGTYDCDANPKTNGYTSGYVNGAVLVGDCYGGILYGHNTAFTITATFSDDC